MRGSERPDERSLRDYHTRQAATAASNEAQVRRNALAQARAEMREVRESVKRAVEFLDRGAIAEAREELLSALAKLEKVRV